MRDVLNIALPLKSPYMVFTSLEETVIDAFARDYAHELWLTFFEFLFNLKYL